MRGTRVILRCFEDIPKVARIWEAGEKIVMIVSEENYKSLLAGEMAFDPVGFRRYDGYPYSVKTLDTPDWDSLKHL